MLDDLSCLQVARRVPRGLSKDKEVHIRPFWQGIAEALDVGDGGCKFTGKRDPAKPRNPDARALRALRAVGHTSLELLPKGSSKQNKTECSPTRSA